MLPRDLTPHIRRPNNGNSLRELFTAMQSAMPPNAPNSLPAQTYVRILAYIMARNDFPEGDQELTADASVLGQSKITRAPGS